MKHVLDQSQIAVAADQRRLEPVDPLAARGPGDHALRPPQRDEIGLSLEVVFDRASSKAIEPRATPPGALVDEHASGISGCLHPGGGVHRVTGHHALADRADRHRDLAGDDTGARRKTVHPDLATERTDRINDVERGADRALGIALDSHSAHPTPP